VYNVLAHTVLLEDVSVTTAKASVNEKWQRFLHEYNITIICKSKKIFIGHILSSSFEVYLTALLTEQSGQNGPRTVNYFFQGSVATLCR